ncbi:predicted protein [Naegleria gruberi]|uniref:Predicted protein n=1 Tax=Naegleria gruberi TaxID=5762 RepID=D2VYM4_NAEGR|nr:uncharacterized protein NAEGRDRAFT_74172 [Naegleria gruberi]EFC38140.1 predicted protein [Naegleria gruberi]|eukprot:XP_002670884.1 predicted protein [Naegleria gruberi strain NEG-M]
MPCRGGSFDYGSTALNTISRESIIEVLAIILGLTNDDNNIHQINSQKSSIEQINNELTVYHYGYRSERISLSNHLLLKGKYALKIRRMFIVWIGEEEINGWFVPNRCKVSDSDDDLRFDPLNQFVNYSYDEDGNAMIDNLELCRRSIVVDFNCGKVAFNFDGMIVGVGSYGYGNNNEALKLACLERFISTSLPSMLVNNVKGRRRSMRPWKKRTKLFNFFSFFKSKKKTNPFQILCEVENVLCSIFEFIDSVELINVVASVSPQFHELIIYNQEGGSQIFGGRMIHFFKKNNIILDSKDVKYLMMIHQTESCIEFYLLSGMIFLEYYKYEMYQAASSFKKTGETLFILDPAMLIENETVLSFIEQKRKKIITISKTTSYANVTNSIPFEKSEGSFFKSIIYSPFLSSSINFEKGLPLYLQFLKDITKKLNDSLLILSQDPDQVWYFEKMMEKAKHFLNESKHKCFDFAPDDVLIGLHFILLDDYYSNCPSDLIPLNFTKILENRNNLNQHANFSSCEFPKDLEIDYLHLLSSEGNGIALPTHHPFNPKLFFYNSLSEEMAQVKDVKEQVKYLELFLDEHIFQLSQADIGQKSTYIQFLQENRRVMPTKEVDLYFHFHMLHSIFFYQECKAIASNVKSHTLLFKSQDDDSKNIPPGHDYPEDYNTQF